MKKSPVFNLPRTRYDGSALIADPIHGYIPFTVPFGPDDAVTEKALIDSPWMQRLRCINQLQSARWVYPSAEHSRFVHSLGAMHLAGRFARHLYPSLAETTPDCPSLAFIESLMRVAVLLHDVGHGPFCHFFDHHFLDTFGLAHEKLGQAIIQRELAPILRRIRRGLEGPFAPGEEIVPEHVAFLIHKDPTYKTPARYPRWLTRLKPLFSGIFTADNLDYVLRDAYMCGVAVGPMDLDRIIHYTFFTSAGLTLHKAGLPALTMFLNARSYLYSNVYYHRTTRALDLHLAGVFRETIREIFPHNPLTRLDAYLDLTDWSLLLAVKSWGNDRNRARRALANEWAAILRREVKWKMACDVTLRGRVRRDPKALEREIRKRLPRGLRQMVFRVDMASQDPRPVNPLTMGERQVYVYDPATRAVSKEALTRSVDALPAALVQCRIYALDHVHDALLSRLAEQVLHVG